MIEIEIDVEKLVDEIMSLKCELEHITGYACDTSTHENENGSIIGIVDYFCIYKNQISRTEYTISNKKDPLNDRVEAVKKLYSLRLKYKKTRVNYLTNAI